MAALAELAAAHEDSLTHPVGPLHISDRVFDVDAAPILMGTVNLSRDSTYRESVAVSQESAVRKARVMAAEGAALVDIGAESSTARAARVDAQQQSDLLLPVIEQLVKDDILVSVETYEPLVVEAALQAARWPVSRRDSLQDLSPHPGARTPSSSNARRDGSMPVTPRDGREDPDSQETCAPS